MPLPNPNYVAMFPLQQGFLDKDLGVPLAAGYILFFKDPGFTLPKDVFIQTQAPGPIFSYTDIGSRVDLSSIGTTQYLGTDQIIFLYPFDANGLPELYYIQVFSSTNILQFTRQGWPPSSNAPGSGSAGFTQSGNIISNPQFAEVLFNNSPSGVVINVTGSMTTAIAPDWNIITTGTGTVTLIQIPITDPLAPGEPAYALDITSASIDSLILSQRITKSPRILENNFASGTFIVEAISPTVSTPVTMNYVPSLGALVPIVVGNATAGSFNPVAGTTNAVIPQTNTNPPGATGYVDIQFVINVGVHIQISCVQLVSVVNSATIAAYVQESVPRQIDHLFHYYKPELEFKPIPSELVGWDFPLNPAQLGASGGPFTNGLVNNSFYSWDQTILFQSVDGSLSYATDSNTDGLQIATANSTRSAVIQYIPANVCRNLLGQRMAISLNGFIAGTGISSLTGTVSLWYTTSTLPALKTPTFVSLVSAVNAGGIPVCANGTWIQVSNNSQNATFSLTPIVGNNFYANDFRFSGFDATATTGQTNATFMAIVIAFDTLPATATYTLNYAGLMSGDIATRPGAQTNSDVIKQCEAYFEKSKSQGVVLTANGAQGALIKQQYAPASGASSFLNTRTFSIEFRTPKISPPTVSLYTEGGTLNDVTGYVYQGVSGQISTGTISATVWTVQNTGTYGVQYLANTSTSYISQAVVATIATESFISFHYGADSRLGWNVLSL